MSKELTVSNIERQNILNNKYAVEAISNHLDVKGVLFNDELYFTQKMVAEFYEIDERTIRRYLKNNFEEISFNGYFLCEGKQLKQFKLQFAQDIYVLSKTTQLGLFNFRAFLNIGMLLTESEKAKQLRSLILDIVISTINKKIGGGTKYINRRDADYLPAAMIEENYRKNLTVAINNCVDGHHTNKYAQVTDMIYKAVFKENVKEYKELLKLKPTDYSRHTMYSEVLLAISSFENGLAYEIKKECENINRKLTLQDVQRVINNLAEHPMQSPYLYDARTKMSSRDLCFRDAYHGNIAEYLKAVSPEEFDRFIGNQSVDFDKILEENQDTLKRLKQAEDE
ncbi:MAG: DNA-binding protein [bacterium]